MKIQNKVFLSLLLSLLVVSAHAQWVRQAKSRAFSRSNGVASDQFGNVYSAGAFVCITAFGEDSLLNNSCGELTPPSPPTAQTDGFLAKHDEDGNLLWVVQFSGSSGNKLFVNDVAVDPTGNAYVTGAYTGSLDLISASFNNPDPTTEYFIIKVHPDGTAEWAHSDAVDNLAETSAQKISVSADAVYITGLVRGKFQVGPAVDSVGRNASFVASFDLTGTHLWTRRFMEINTNGSSRGKALDAKGDSIFVFSSFTDTVNIDGNLVRPPGANPSIDAGVICLYNSSGTLLNSVLTNTPFIESLKYHRPDESLYVTGRAENVTAIGDDTLFVNAGTRAYVSSHDLEDPALDLQWVVPLTATTTSGLSGLDIDVSTTGNIVAAGTFNSGTINAPTTSATGGGALNGFMIKLDRAGVDQWIQSFGGGGDDAIPALSAREDSRIFAAGYFAQYLRVAGDEIYSNTSAGNGFVARIDICPQLVADMISPDSTYICSRESAIFQVTNNAVYAYQWYKNGVPVPGSDSPDLEVAEEATYRVEMTGAGCTKFTPIAKLFLRPLPDSVVLTNDAMEKCEGQSVTLVGPVGSYTFQWLNNGIPMSDITKDLTVQSDGDYRLEITDAQGCSILSDTFAVRFHPYPAIALTPPPGRYRLCDGNSLTIQADNSQPGMTWQWRRDDIPIANADDFELEVTTSGIYHALVSNAIGCQTITEKDTVVVQASPIVDLNNQTLPTSVCEGVSLRLVTRNVQGQLYQWFKDGAPIPGATANMLDISASGEYTVRVNNVLCEKFSDPFDLSVNPLPGAVITNNAQTSICEGDEYDLAAQEAANYTYEWLHNGQLIPGQNASTLSIVKTGNYIVQTANEFGCTDRSPATTVVVNLKPPASITKEGELVFCEGGDVVFHANAGTALQYEWFKDGAFMGLTQRSIVVSESGTFQVRVTNSNLCRDVSSPVIVEAVPYPVSTITSAQASNSICERDSLLLTGNASSSTYTYEWLRNGVSLNDETSSTFYAKSSGSYKVVTSQRECRDTSAVLNLHVRSNPLPVITRNEAFLSIALFGDIQWFRNDDPIAGANLQAIRATDDGQYSVNVINAEGCSAWSEDMPVCLPIPALTKTNDLLSVTIDAQSYRWAYGGIPIEGAVQRQLKAQQSGSYSAIVVSPDGCIMETSPVTVCIPYPYITQDEFSGVLYAFPNPAASYQWYQDGEVVSDGNTQVHIPDYGVYSVEVTDLEGCVSSSEPVILTPVTGVGEDYRHLHFYPNPADDFLIVEVFSGESLSIEIIDAMGRRVRQIQHSLDRDLIDIGDLPSGVYSLIAGGDRTAAWRLIVK